MARTVAWAEVVPRPWRNGGGVTRELLAWPAGPDWQIRLSVAEIRQDGPFSVFPGVSRWFVVMAGAGVELAWPQRLQRLRVGDPPCRFAGADAPDCRLIQGATQDLNLMLHDAEGGLWPAQAGMAWQPGHAQCGLFARDAVRVQVDDKAALQLPAMSLCWWSAAPQRLCIDGPATTDAAAPAAWWIGASPRVRETAR